MGADGLGMTIEVESLEFPMGKCGCERVREGRSLLVVSQLQLEGHTTASYCQRRGRCHDSAEKTGNGTTYAGYSQPKC